jgi:uncharacterized LabA/DUF88 family protein
MFRDSPSDRNYRRSRWPRNRKTLFAAVLADFENIYNTLAQEVDDGREDPVGDVQALDDSVEILSALRERLRERNCVMAIGRSYADFDRLGGDAQSQLQLLAFEPRFMLGDKQKSTADILLSIDAIEMLHTRPELDMFVIVGGHRGFLPVVRRLREHMKRVILVGFEKSTSGDLRQVVGDDNFIAAETLLPEPLLPEPLPAAEDNGRHRHLPSHDHDDEGEGLAPEADTPSDDETLETCMEELLTAYYQYGGKTVWLTPFLRMLNEKFPYLDNRGRKRLVEDLQARNAIRIDKVEGDPYPYSVVEINWESEWVRTMDEARGNV